MKPKFITLETETAKRIAINLRETKEAYAENDIWVITLFNGDQYKGKLINQK